MQRRLHVPFFGTTRVLSRGIVRYFRWLTIMRVATLLEMFGSRGVARRFLFPTQSVRAVRRRTTTNMLTAACLP